VSSAALQFLRLKLLAGLILFVLGLAVAGGILLVLDRLGRRPCSRWERRVALGALAALGLGGLCFLYALLIEPNWLEVTHLEVQTSRLQPGQRIRLVLLSDLHVDRLSPVLRELPAVVNAQHPDLLIFTGDSLNSAGGAPLFREALGGIQAPLGRFAVRGNHDVDHWSALDLFGGGVATELRGGEPVLAAGGTLALCGAAYGGNGHLERCLRRAPADAFKIIAYHTPDLVEDLAWLEPDLYVAGHTHGGQVRAPFYGALITFSRFDKKYEMGRYQVGKTTLYVNRGLGFEPRVPRIRFLARPEVTVLDLVGAGPAGGAPLPP
jgi:hypothetical protein